MTIAANEVKERPIIFSAPIVRAILNGTKTQTRRAIKPQPPTMVRTIFKDDVNCWWGSTEPGGAATVDDLAGRIKPCPYGAVGDRLWVKETWRYELVDGVYGVGLKSNNQFVPASNGLQRAACAAGISGSAHGVSRWQTHTPRWASRITLEITDVRVERLWDIGGKDVIAEGVPCLPFEHGAAWESDTRSRMARDWNQIHGPGAWERENVWVWAISFHQVESA